MSKPPPRRLRHRPQQPAEPRAQRAARRQRRQALAAGLQVAVSSVEVENGAKLTCFLEGGFFFFFGGGGSICLFGGFFGRVLGVFECF